MRCFLILLISVSAYCQTQRFQIISEATGDLNNDGTADKVVVLQDTLHDKLPYRFQLFIGNDTFFESDSILTPQYPDGKRQMPIYVEYFDSVEIKKGILTVNFELTRGNYVYKFRWDASRNDFEMIGYSNGLSDGIQLFNAVDFNLKTGVRIEKIENFNTGKTVSNKKRNLSISPSPLLSQIRIGLDEPYQTN